MNSSAFSTNKNQGLCQLFVTVSWDLRAYRVTPDWQHPWFSVVLEATHETIERHLRGAMSAQKSPSRVRGRDEGVLGKNGSEDCPPPRWGVINLPPIWPLTNIWLLKDSLITYSLKLLWLINVNNLYACYQVPLTTAFQRVGDELSSYPSDNSLTILMGPTQRDMVQAVVDFVEKMAWKNVALVSHRASGWFGRTHSYKKSSYLRI